MSKMQEYLQGRRNNNDVRVELEVIDTKKVFELIENNNIKICRG